MIDEMEDIQLEMEFNCSKHHVKTTILDYIQTDIQEFILMVEAIRLYLSKTYSYDSKNERIEHLRKQMPEDELALEILLTVLPIQEISPVQGACTKIGHSLNYPDSIDGIKTAGELLAVTEGYLFDLYAHDWSENTTGTMGIKSKLPLDDDLATFLSGVQYLPPMLCKPRRWTSNTKGGYLSFDDSVILGKNNHHTECQSLDVLNALQKVAFVLDPEILALQELPPKELNTPQSKLQFELQAKISADLYEVYKDLEFYFVWKNDKRGRIYSQGYHINLQGYEYKRALLSFAKEYIITTEICF